jgi:hypothetical protein
MAASTAFPAPSTPVAQLTEQAGAWADVTLAPRPERAVAFRLDDATIGVLHHDGLLEVPLPAPIRGVLVEEEFARPHPTRSGAEWVAVRVQSAESVEAAALLLRLSYLYRRLLRSQDPALLRRIRVELDQYGLPDALSTLYETMLAKRDPDSSTHSGTPSSA